MNRSIGLVIVAVTSLGLARSIQLPSAGSLGSDVDVDQAILMISLDDPGQAYVQQIVQGFQEILADAPRPPVLYLEFFDQVRFPQIAYPQEFYQWLSRKYRDRRVDVIVAVQQLTLQVLAEQPDHPWRRLPIVYSSLGDLTIDVSGQLPMATGVVRENNFPAALRTIKTLLPDTRRIALVYGASTAERERNLWFVSQVVDAGLEVLDLSGSTMDDLLTHVAQLPAGTVPFFLEFQRDAAGRAFTHSRACELVATAANQPLFSLFRHYFGCGVVGGPLTDFAEVGRLIARHSLKRLGSESAATVTIPVAEYAPLVFDARQLTRWGIPENHLPEGSTVFFRPPSLWRDYRLQVTGALAVGAIQTLLTIVILFERRRRTRAQTALRNSFMQVQDLAGRLITAQEAERTRIARELHDDVGQRVASFSMAVGVVKRQLADAAPGVQNDLAALQKETIALSRDLRQLSHELHPGVLEHLGLAEALKARCDEVQIETGIAVQLEVGPELGTIPADAALCLYRIAQEALRNIAKHAHAATARISLTRHDGQLAMSVVDDGCGFERGTPSGLRGLGLISLDERVRMLNGTFVVTSALNAGTRVLVTLPMGDIDAATTSAHRR